MMLHTQYQRPGPSTLRQEDCLSFSPIQVYVKQVTPRGEIIFDPMAKFLNNLGRSPLDDDTYQISKAGALYFQKIYFFKCSIYETMQGRSHFLTPEL